MISIYENSNLHNNIIIDNNVITTRKLLKILKS